MSLTPGSTPQQAVTCSTCGRENAAGRQFCYFCRQPLSVPPEGRADSDEQIPRVEEAQPAQNVSQAAEDENRGFRQQLESLRQELDKARAAGARTEAASAEVVAALRARLKSAEDRAASLESHAAGWEEKWKSAEEKARSFEEKLFAKSTATAAEARTKSLAEVSRLVRLIVGALVVLCGVGGYLIGHYVPRNVNPNEKVSRLSTQLKSAQNQIRSLNQKVTLLENGSKSALDSANRKISGLTNELTALGGRYRLGEQKRASAQRALASSQDQLKSEMAKEHALDARRVAQITGLTQQNSQLQAEIQERDNRINALRRQVAGLSNRAASRAGFLIWSGTVAGKRKVDIKNGVPNFGVLVSGGLPRKPCALANPDPVHVALKTLPSRRNQWNRVSFVVSGRGIVRVRINWVLSQ